MPILSGACDKISGAYQMYYVPHTTTLALTMSANVLSLGITGPEGVRFTREDHVDPIYDDENGPDAVQDVVMRGASATLEFVLEDIDREVVYQLLYPWSVNPATGASLPGRPDYYGVPGRFGCAVGGKIEAVPIIGSAADTAGFPVVASGLQSRKFYGIIESPVVENFDTAPRFIPIRFRCLPFYDAADSDIAKMFAYFDGPTLA